MAEPVAEHSNVSPRASSPHQKRKRAAADQTGPGERRAKRSVPVTMPSSDAPTLGYDEHMVTAALNADDVDLNPLQQANEATEQSQAADPANASSTAAAALGSMFPTLSVPASTEQQFAQAASEGSRSHEPSFSVADAANTSVASVASIAPSSSSPPPANGVLTARQIRIQENFRKPPVGSDEWHKLRKDNHKEVERRRRETINEGINELAKIVPGCEKNKGSILQKAVQFIVTLKQNEQSNIEKWTLEKLLTEQAIGELSQSNEKLKEECARLYRELETYKRVCQGAGLEVPAAKAAGATATTATAPS